MLEEFYLKGFSSRSFRSDPSSAWAEFLLG